MKVDAYILQADARNIPLADESVQCVVTSPPYWGLRKYAGAQDLVWGDAGCDHVWVAKRYYTEQTAAAETGEAFSVAGDENAARLKAGRWREYGTCERCGAWRGAFGLEPTIELYVQHTVEILREIRRVLRKDGVVFWNVGDSYCGATSEHKNLGSFGKHSCISKKSQSGIPQDGRGERTRAMISSGIKPKDLCLIPSRVAIAAQSDGWWVRSLIIWNKPNPMPESVTDRPTDAYEHVIMLTKSQKYFWDADAVRETATCDRLRGTADYEQVPNGGDNSGLARRDSEGSRNIRNVWTIPTQPYRGAHFATFPEEIPRRCILAATSERGACRQCGASWDRVAETEYVKHEKWFGEKQDARNSRGSQGTSYNEPIGTRTIGWTPTCRCTGQRGQTQPCLVLDPFAGSGTTGRVAVELNRRAVLIDLAYHDHAEKRTRNVQRRLMETA
jgi:DNA modification methylase